MELYSLSLGLLLSLIGFFVGRSFAFKREKVLLLESSTLKERTSILDNQLLHERKEREKLHLQAESLTKELYATREDRIKLEITLKEERKAIEERLAIVENNRDQLSQIFKSLSADILNNNNQSFIELATQSLGKTEEKFKGEIENRSKGINEIVSPLRESIEKLQKELKEMERLRSGAYEGIAQQVKALAENSSLLRQETVRLTNALAAPTSRGQWGEFQLKRIVELAGMIEYCDFEEQAESALQDGGKIRPDLIVKLPADRVVVVDAKVPLKSFIEALSEDNENLKKEKIKLHAEQLRQHVLELGRKKYWENLPQSTEFVVMFLPAEALYATALDVDSQLIEFCATQRVVIATPSTLIALLRAVAYGWKQSRMDGNAQKIAELGRELYKRVYDLTDNLTRLGTSLKGSVESYNKAIGTLESRVLISARKLSNFDATTSGGVTLPDEVNAIEVVPRSLRESLESEKVKEGREEYRISQKEASDVQ